MSGWIIATLAGIAAGTAGALGLGGGSVLLLYLTVFAGMTQRHAQGINLIFFIPCAITAVLTHSRSGLVAWREALPCAAVGLLGSVGGYLLAGAIDEEMLRKIFAIFLLVLGGNELLRPAERKSGSRTPTGFCGGKSRLPRGRHLS